MPSLDFKDGRESVFIETKDWYENITAAAQKNQKIYFNTQDREQVKALDPAHSPPKWKELSACAIAHITDGLVETYNAQELENIHVALESIKNEASGSFWSKITNFFYRRVGWLSDKEALAQEVEKVSRHIFKNNLKIEILNKLEGENKSDEFSEYLKGIKALLPEGDVTRLANQQLEEIMANWTVYNDPNHLAEELHDTSEEGETETKTSQSYAAVIADMERYRRQLKTKATPSHQA